MDRRRGKCAEDPGPGESRIPRPDLGALRRSASLRMRGERVNGAGPVRHFPSISEAGEHHHSVDPKPRSLSLSLCATPPTRPPATSTPHSYPLTPTSSPQQTVEVDEDDLDSVRSFGSVFSTMSCDHAYIARNGTTFSGRRMKYVVHCSSHAGETEEYLTPTQRATRQIRRLKALLKQAHADLEEKNGDVFRLTKEVLELRLYKASLAPPDRRPLDDETPEEDKITASDLPSSLADSGHFEDMACLSVHSPHFHSEEPQMSGSEDREGERRRIVRMFEKRMEEMTRRHVEEQQELKEKHNDKVDNLLRRLSDSSDRYSDLRIEYDTAQDRIRELEKEVESLRKSMANQEERHQSMYLKMYVKGQEAARFEHADQVLEFAHQAPGRVSVPELLKQLQVTEDELENIKDTTYDQPDKSKTLLSAKEAVSLYLLGTRKAMYRRIVESRAGQSKIEPEITLQFLKSAVYYFFTDRENQQGHLNAIQSILGFSDNEKQNIEKAYRMHK